MNEIITRLNEIEEKADAILTAAGEQKEAMAVQFEADKREIDRKYEQLLADDIRELEDGLKREAERETADFERRSEEELKRLKQMFMERWDALAEQIANRIIQ